MIRKPKIRRWLSMLLLCAMLATDVCSPILQAQAALAEEPPAIEVTDAEQTEQGESVEIPEAVATETGDEEETSEPTAPAEEPEPVEPAAPMEEPEPVEPAAPAEEPEPVEPAAPAEEPEPAKPAAPEEEPEPAEPAALEEEPEAESNGPAIDKAAIELWKTQLANQGYSKEDIAIMVAALNAPEGSLQSQINSGIVVKLNGMTAQSSGVRKAPRLSASPTTIELTDDEAENLVILDGETVTLDLNGHTLTPVRSGGNTTINAITVYGTLIVKDSAGGGKLSAGSVEDVRGVTVASRGSFTLKSGTIAGYNIDGSGAGVRVEKGGSFVMEGGTISGNTAGDYGGGIYAYAANDVEITGGTVKENKAQNGGGLAFNRVNSDNNNTGTFTIKNLTVEGNTATALGGGLYFDSAITVKPDSLTVSGNQAAASGGGIYFASASTLELTAGDTVKNNTATTDGGGIAMAGIGSTLNIDGAEIKDNTSGHYGGGAYVAQKGTVNLSSGTVSGNKANDYGGGIALYSLNNNRSTFTMTGGEISNNTLTKDGDSRYGAGLWIHQYATVNLTAGKISGNTNASHGGGVFVDNYGVVTMGKGMEISQNHIAATSSGTGAGMYLGGSTDFTMNGGVICDNEGDTGGCGGGGFHISTGTAVLDGGAIIERNTATGSGGGIVVSSSATITVRDAVIRENRAYDNGAQGGGISATNGGTVILENGAQIKDNYARDIGGGLSGANVTIREGAVVSGNEAGSGGGVRAGSTLLMTGGEISGNTATSGGGILIHSGTPISHEISGGRIVDNTATSGGGILVGLNNDNQPLALTLTGDAVISGNTATSNGGGIYLNWRGCLIMTGGTITGNTATGNAAASGGGGIYQIYVSAAPTEELPVGLDIQGGAVYGNHTNGLGNDLRVVSAWVNSSTISRPRFKICPAAEMSIGESGKAWMDEYASGALITAAFDNLERTAALEADDEVGTHTTANWAYTFTFTKPVAEIGGMTYPSVQAAMDAAGDSDTVVMLTDSVENVTVPVGKTVTLDLAGYRLSAPGSGSVIEVKEKANLTLLDSSETKTGQITNGKGTPSRSGTSSTALYGGGIFVGEEAKLTLNGGSITGNSAGASCGSGVYLSDGAEMVMNGGSITANSDVGVRVYRPEQNVKGASGGATFTLYGGEISSNGSWGVAGNASACEITIAGGTIKGNKSCGVYFGRGHFAMTDGVIKENSSDLGGGIRLITGGTAEISGGQIINNTASNGGGGIYVTDPVHLTISGGALISGNTAKTGEGGGVWFNSSSTTASFNMTGGAIYRNIAAGQANDIYFIANTSVVSLRDAKDMGVTGIDCWYEAGEDRDYTSENLSAIIGRQAKAFYLTAAQTRTQIASVCRIGATRYATLQSAINEINSRGETGDRTIYLLKDVTESVILSAPKVEGAITVDLNGYDLTPDKKQVFYVNGGQLILRSTDTEEDVKESGDGGRLLGTDADDARAVYVQAGSFTMKQGVTISDFHGADNGGAIYVDSGGAVRLEGGTIKNCSATNNGGAVYALSNSTSSSLDFAMSDGVIENCSATNNGGGVYCQLTAAQPKAGYSNRFVISGGTIRNCKATNRAGAVYVTGSNLAEKPNEFIEVYGVTVEGNSSEINTGGLYFLNCSPTIGKEDVPTIVRYNSAGRQEGGLRIEGNTQEYHVATITNVDIKDNEAVTGYGGACVTVPMRMTGCSITDNRTTGPASNTGGLYVSCGSKAATFVKDTVISGNSSYSVAGMWLGIVGDGSTFDNVKITNNVAKGTCGGVGGWYHQYTDGTTITFKNCEISNNTAAISGGMRFEYNRATFVLEDTKVNNNVATTGDTGGLSFTHCNNLPGYLVLRGNTEISGNVALNGSNGAIRTAAHLTIQDNVKITGNRAQKSCGGVSHVYYSLTMTGGEISGNVAETGNGGGLYVSTNETLSDQTVVKLEGGVIKNNTAGGYGGGFLNGGYCNQTTISGTVITDNVAGGNGGGVWCSENTATVELEQDGKIYNNHALLGQDVYGNYSSTYRNSELKLITAEQMFAGDETRDGIGWLDEVRNEIITVPIQGKLVRYYALTLNYATKDTIVAKIGDKVYNSVQKAVDDIYKGVYSDDEQPEIVMVADSTENVSIPAGVNVKLNLNHHTLTGNGTSAISCAGTLRILDEPPEDAGNNEVGTITGTSADAGGGVYVLCGGEVTMSSGQIANCRAASGAAVCVDAGSFILTGEASLNNNNASNGAAVLVRNAAGTFTMTGGVIEENTARGSGIVYNQGGKVQINAGVICNNTVATNGTLYNTSGTMSVVGSEDSKVQIVNNTVAQRGGGVHVNSGTVTLENVVIRDNEVTYARQSSVNGVTGAGGGIYVNSGTLYINEGTEITGNHAARGGGIYQNSGKISMIGGSITKNTAEIGGGVAQYPESVGEFVMMQGLLADNRSTLYAAGNDFYSWYEGSGNYDVDWSTGVPKVTLLPAAQMDSEQYNVWKNDSYEGENRTGTSVTEGQYITSNLNAVFNVQLTADYYKVETEKPYNTDVHVSSILLTGEDCVIDGTAVWDTASAGTEKTAAELYAAGEAGWEQIPSEDGTTITAYTFEGRTYEPDQMGEWTPGDDSNSKNGLVRSFDALQYTLTVSLEADQDAEDGINRTVHTWMEITLPCAPAEAEFDQSVLNQLFKGRYSVSTRVVDGQTVQVCRGYWEQSMVDSETVEKNIRINVHGMMNGATLKPTFKAWIEGNEDNTEHPAECVSKTITVSAAPKYNVSIDYNETLTYSSYFDLANGVEISQQTWKDDPDNPNYVRGTMLGYGIMVELYNDPAGKGLKGLELPADGLEFDLSMKGQLYYDGQPVPGSEDTQAPFIWAYKENENTAYGKPLGGTRYSYIMDWNDEDDTDKTTQYAYNAASFNGGGNDRSCYNGGYWAITGDQPDYSGGNKPKETTVHVKVNGYSFNSDANPSKTSDGVSSNILKSSAVKAFTAGYIQVIFPYDKDQVEQDYYAVTGKAMNGYLAISMESVATGLDIKGASDVRAPLSNSDPSAIKEYYKDADEGALNGLATNEVTYTDNYSSHSFGQYILHGGGGDSIVKTNYFLKENRSTLTGSGGDGSTPIGSVVYVGATGTFGSQTIRTDDPDDRVHYIDPKAFNPQTDNLEEFNYMTAMNLLQKFDADAYTPVAADLAVVQERYELTGADNYITGTDSNGQSVYAFWIKTSEAQTEWSATKTKSYTLTILYAAKPDGTNWENVADMDRYREENLLYFTTLKDLQDYFGGDGKCVGILYEFRDCAIRTGRSISANARLQVTDEFEKTGGTYCTTNDVRTWSTYRPEYKKHFTDGTLDNILFTYDYVEHPLKNRAYGVALPAGQVYVKTREGDQLEDGGEYSPDALKEKSGGWTKFSASSYFDGYVKSEYSNGSRLGSTHTGWYSGNTLLLYTLDTSVSISNTDYADGSNTPMQAYYVNQGQRTANFRIKPEIGISSEASNNKLVTNGTQNAKITLEVTIPAGLTYRDQSIQFDYDESKSGYSPDEMQWDVLVGQRVVHDDGTVTVIPGGKNADGTQTMLLQVYVSDIDKTLPYVRYACDIGDPINVEKDVKNGQSLATKVEIRAEYEEHSRVAAQTHADSVTIQIVKENDSGIFKGVNSTLLEVGEDLEYTLNYLSDSTDSKNIQMVDVLPYNGDGRGTSFTGAYRVAEIKVTFTDQESYDHFVASEGGGVIGYGSGATVQQKNADQNRQVSDLSESKTALVDGANGVTVTMNEESNTVTYTINNDTLLQNADTATGIALYGRFPNISGAKKEGNKLVSRSGVIVTVTLSPKSAAKTADGKEQFLTYNNKTQTGGNVYGNTFLYQDGTAPALSSTRVSITTVSRTVSGVVWMDRGYDGYYVTGSDDSPMKNVDVILLQKNGENWVQATDVLGNPVAAVKTDQDGKYQFTNLSAGEYQVMIKNDHNDYALADGTRPIEFSKLSVTLRDTAQQGAVSGNKGVPGVLNYTRALLSAGRQSSLTEFKGAILHDSVQMPVKSAISGGTYAVANRNFGLYYIDATIEKDWENMPQHVEQGTEVTLDLTGTVKNEGTSEDETVYSAKFVLKQEADKVTATENGEPVNVTDDTVATPSGTTYQWKTSVLPLQAEDNGRPITYSLSEASVKIGDNDVQNWYKDPVISAERTQGTTALTLKAVNTRLVKNLTITKTVSGNMGNRAKKFTFTVKLTDIAGGTVSGTFNCEGGSDTTITFKEGTASVELAHDERIKILGLPHGIKYTVTEDAGSALGYKTTVSNNGGQSTEDRSSSGQLNGDTTISFVNDRTVAVPTSADSIPYTAMMLFAILPVIMICKRRRRQKGR